MEDTLDKLAETSPDIAQRMFDNLEECIACGQCAIKTRYTFQGKDKWTCHGRVGLKMSISDFEDARAFIRTVNELVR
jgi:ferredoxin